MFHHLNTNRWDLHINQPRDESCIKHVCCISRMNFYRSDFKNGGDTTKTTEVLLEIYDVLSCTFIFKFYKYKFLTI